MTWTNRRCAALAAALALPVALAAQASSAPEVAATPPVLSSAPASAAAVAGGRVASAQTQALFKRIRTAIQKNQLTPLRVQCLLLEELPSGSPGLLLVVVKERHDEACGGDPGTAPRLFSVQVDRKSGQMRSDARSLDGSFEPLR